MFIMVSPSSFYINDSFRSNISSKMIPAVLMHKLFEIGAIRFGQFTLKSGASTPFYIDLRLLVSDPKLLMQFAEHMHGLMRDLAFDCICPVPYAAIPLATSISIAHLIPMIFCRKEKKGYGTAKLIEGIFEPKMRCLVIEDIIVYGDSILETISHLKQADLIVTDVIAVMDREQGGVAKFKRTTSKCTLLEKFLG